MVTDTGLSDSQCFIIIDSQKVSEFNQFSNLDAAVLAAKKESALHRKDKSILLLSHMGDVRYVSTVEVEIKAKKMSEVGKFIL